MDSFNNHTIVDSQIDIYNCSETEAEENSNKINTETTKHQLSQPSSALDEILNDSTDQTKLDEDTIVDSQLEDEIYPIESDKEGDNNQNEKVKVEISEQLNEQENEQDFEQESCISIPEVEKENGQENFNKIDKSSLINTNVNTIKEDKKLEDNLIHFDQREEMTSESDINHKVSQTQIIDKSINIDSILGDIDCQEKKIYGITFNEEEKMNITNEDFSHEEIRQIKSNIEESIILNNNNNNDSTQKDNVNEEDEEMDEDDDNRSLHFTVTQTQKVNVFLSQNDINSSNFTFSETQIDFEKKSDSNLNDTQAKDGTIDSTILPEMPIISDIPPATTSTPNKIIPTTHITYHSSPENSLSDEESHENSIVEISKQSLGDIIPKFNLEKSISLNLFDNTSKNQELNLRNPNSFENNYSEFQNPNDEEGDSGNLFDLNLKKLPNTPKELLDVLNSSAEKLLIIQNKLKSIDFFYNSDEWVINTFKLNIKKIYKDKYADEEEENEEKEEKSENSSNDEYNDEHNDEDIEFKKEENDRILERSESVFATQDCANLLIGISRKFNSFSSNTFSNPNTTPSKKSTPTSLNSSKLNKLRRKFQVKTKQDTEIWVDEQTFQNRLLSPKPTDSSKLNEEKREDNFYKKYCIPSFYTSIELVPTTWSILWKDLEEIGWTWVKGRGLIDYYYLKPYVEKPSNPYKLDLDYFSSMDSVFYYIKSKCEQFLPSNKKIPPNKNDTDSQEENIVNKRKRAKNKLYFNENEEEMSENEEVEVKVSKKRTKSSAPSTPTTTLKKLSTPNHVENLLSSSELSASVTYFTNNWKVLWKILRSLGWYWDFSSTKSFYYYPGYDSRRDAEAIEGQHKFKNNVEVIKFILKDFDNSKKTQETYGDFYPELLNLINSSKKNNVIYDSPINENLKTPSKKKSSTATTNLFSSYIFFITGFDEKLRKRIETLIEKHGGEFYNNYPKQILSGKFHSEPSISSYDFEVYDEKKKKNIIVTIRNNYKKMVLISDSNNFRKPKFLIGLIAGITMLHYNWIIDSIESLNLLEKNNYYLPATYSALNSCFIYDHITSNNSKPSSILRNLRVLNLTGFSAWDEILLCSGAVLIEKKQSLYEKILTVTPELFTKSNYLDIDVILFDPVIFSKINEVNVSTDDKNKKKELSEIEIDVLNHMNKIYQYYLVKNKKKNTNNFFIPYIVSVDWLLHCVSHNKFLSPSLLDIFLLPNDPIYKPLAIKVNNSERYAKHDLVYFESSAGSSTYLMGKIIGFTRRNIKSNYLVNIFLINNVNNDNIKNYNKILYPNSSSNQTLLINSNQLVGKIILLSSKDYYTYATGYNHEDNIYLMSKELEELWKSDDGEEEIIENGPYSEDTL